MSALRFAPLRSSPAEPYEPLSVDPDPEPALDLLQEIYRAERALMEQRHAITNELARHMRPGEFTVSERRLDGVERAATALNTATAIYRARRRS